MAVLRFYAFVPADGDEGGGHFEGPALTVEAGAATLVPADLCDTALEEGVLNGSDIVQLGGRALHLTKVILAGIDHYADREGTDLAALGTMDGAAKALSDGDFGRGAGLAQGLVRGTLVKTSVGLVAVEDLTTDHQIETVDDGPMPCRWIASNRIVPRWGLLPIRIEVGAFRDWPDETLFLSPDQRIVVRGWQAEVLFGTDEVLARAGDLDNGGTVSRMIDAKHVEYFHILLAKPALILANAIPCESLNLGEIDLGELSFDVRRQILEFAPDLEQNRAAYRQLARPLVSGKEARLIADS